MRRWPTLLIFVSTAITTQKEIVMKSGGARMLVLAPMVHAEWSVVRLLYQHFVAVPD